MLPFIPRGEALASLRPTLKGADIARQDSTELARQHSAPLAAKQLALRLMGSPLGAAAGADADDASQPQLAADSKQPTPTVLPGRHLCRCCHGLWQMRNAGAGQHEPTRGQQRLPHGAEC